MEHLSMIYRIMAIKNPMFHDVPMVLKDLRQWNSSSWSVSRSAGCQLQGESVRVIEKLRPSSALDAATLHLLSVGQ